MAFTPSAPAVCVIVLNRNGRQHLEYSLASICATEYENLSVLLVDNGSVDDSLEMARSFPVEILSSQVNLGWSGGNNMGIRRAIEKGAAYVVLANNDIKVHPRWIAEAVRVAESEPDIAVVGFDVHEPVPGTEDRDAGFTRACERWTRPHLTLPTFVGGMAMFARTLAFQELGLIDENFFVYGEENDFQIRARRAAYRVVGVDVPVWHFGQGFFGKTSAWASLLQTENNIQLLVKHQGLGALPRAAFRHLVRRCVPGRRPVDESSSVERRLGAGGALRAVAIAAVASCRIVGRLPAILRRRREDERRIAAVLNGRHSVEA